MAREIVACIGSETPPPHIPPKVSQIFKKYYPQDDFRISDIVVVATGVFDGLSRFVKGVDTGYGVGSGLVQIYDKIAKRVAEESVDETIRASCSKEETDAVRDDVAVLATLTMLITPFLAMLGLRESVGGVGSVAGSFFAFFSRSNS